MRRILGLTFAILGITAIVAAASARAYDVVADKHGDIWSASMFTDRVVRLTPETGEFVEYPLPEQATNIRRVFVDNAAPRTVFWAGSNHNAGILKVEPLD